MNSPLKGNTTSSTGWTGMRTSIDAPRTVDRKRRGRNIDIIGESLPTPSSSRHAHLPTPETVRRPAKSPRKAVDDLFYASTSTTHLPTPQTQPRQRRVTSNPTEKITSSPPSPSGHTTFYLSSSAAATSRPEKIRRRPGLTFAQQMGLVSTSTRGVGVGMGGHRSSAHGKVDQITSSVLVSGTDDNPFLVPSTDGQMLGAPLGIASPGLITIHQPGDDHDSEDELLHASPFRPVRRSPRLASPSPSATTSKPSLPFAFASGLLSPPPTQHAARVGVISGSGKTKALTREQKAQRERARREAEERRRMLDFKDNPFLVKPGESSSRRPGPIVDEDRPTVTYVFRGAKKVFANPLYPSQAPFPQASLDPADEEFEPHPLPKPKLLWPTGPSPTKALKRYPTRTPSPDLERSPPSSPVSTPTMMSLGRGQGRFGTLARVHSGGGLEGGPKEVFTDDEEVVISQHGDEEEDDEDALPTRRGLLFGGTAKGSSMVKRSLDLHEDRKAKKARGTFRL